MINDLIKANTIICSPTTQSVSTTSNGAGTQANTSTSVSTCPSGYEVDGETCVDIDECATGDHHCGQD